MTHATVEVHLFSFCLQRVVTYRSSILIVSQEMILEEIKAFCGTDPSPPPSTRTWGPWPWCMYSIDALSFLLKTCSRVFFEFSSIFSDEKYCHFSSTFLTRRFLQFFLENVPDCFFSESPANFSLGLPYVFFCFLLPNRLFATAGFAYTYRCHRVRHRGSKVILRIRT